MWCVVGNILCQQSFQANWPKLKAGSMKDIEVIRNKILGKYHTHPFK